MSENIVNKLTLPSGGGSGDYSVVAEFKTNSTQIYEADPAGCMHIVQTFDGGDQLVNYEFSKVYISFYITLGNSATYKSIQFNVSNYTTPEAIIRGIPLDNSTSIFSVSTIVFCQISGWDEESNINTWEYINLPVAACWFEGKLVINFPETIRKPDGVELKFSETYPDIYYASTLIQLIK